MIALIVFLLCALAGAAVLTMATVNAGRYTHQIADQQKYLSVSSAVGLVRDELSGFKVTVTFNDAAVSATTSGSDMLGKLQNSVIAKCKALAIGTDEGTYAGAPPQAAQDEEIILRVSGEAAAKIDAVKVRVSVTASGDLRFTFATEKDYAYRTTLTASIKEYSVTASGDGYACEFGWDAENATIERCDH